ncbi:isochorismatase family protein [Paenibacillus sp. 1011MAR3C5]|uniref:cysteine hydrolase family protein n=1 Tax=Paenibacillus sp. 1011MAR3C5 TaxID=1675787 RepID=UPI000E6BBD54|nr:isochorismatase family protein [Paenibacillus sp. 1011MAR3C5]RJE90284.1 isochorismatase family protein [Paenibacillus sp. 1011MAR3C5]
MNIALIIIDMQEIYLRQVDAARVESACEYINHVAAMVRSSNQLVVHVQDVDGMDETNQELYATVPGVRMESSDLVVTKLYSNSFWQTELEQLLRDHQIDFVVISGFAMEHCVLFTYNGAIERGFTPALLQRGVLSEHVDSIAAAYRDRHVVSHPAIKLMLKNS